MRTFVDSFTKQSQVLMDAEEALSKISENVRSKIHECMHTLTQHVLASFGRWNLSLGKEEWAQSCEETSVASCLPAVVALKLEEVPLLEIKSSEYTTVLESCLAFFNDKANILDYLKEPETDEICALQDQLAEDLLPHMRLAEHQKLKEAMGSEFDAMLAHMDRELFDYMQEHVAESPAYKDQKSQVGNSQHTVRFQ